MNIENREEEVGREMGGEKGWYSIIDNCSVLENV